MLGYTITATTRSTSSTVVVPVPDKHTCNIAGHPIASKSRVYNADYLLFKNQLEGNNTNRITFKNLFLPDTRPEFHKDHGQGNRENNPPDDHSGCQYLAFHQVACNSKDTEYTVQGKEHAGKFF